MVLRILTAICCLLVSANVQDCLCIAQAQRSSSQDFEATRTTNDSKNDWLSELIADSSNFLPIVLRTSPALTTKTLVDDVGILSLQGQDRSKLEFILSDAFSTSEEQKATLKLSLERIKEWKKEQFFNLMSSKQPDLESAKTEISDIYDQADDVLLPFQQDILDRFLFRGRAIRSGIRELADEVVEDHGIELSDQFEKKLGAIKDKLNAEFDQEIEQYFSAIKGELDEQQLKSLEDILKTLDLRKLTLGSPEQFCFQCLEQHVSESAGIDLGSEELKEALEPFREIEKEFLLHSKSFLVQFTGKQQVFEFSFLGVLEKVNAYLRGLGTDVPIPAISFSEIRMDPSFVDLTTQLTQESEELISRFLKGKYEAETFHRKTMTIGIRMELKRLEIFLSSLPNKIREHLDVVFLRSLLSDRGLGNSLIDGSLGTRIGISPSQKQQIKIIVDRTGEQVREILLDCEIEIWSAFDQFVNIKNSAGDVPKNLILDRDNLVFDSVFPSPSLLLWPRGKNVVVNRFSKLDLVEEKSK